MTSVARKTHVDNALSLPMLRFLYSNLFTYVLFVYWQYPIYQNYFSCFTIVQCHQDMYPNSWESEYILRELHLFYMLVLHTKTSLTQL